MVPAMSGRWTARDVTLRDGHLRLTLKVTPATVHLPVRSGPAVLFVGIGASGGSGDVGYQHRLRVDTETAPACTGDPCRYRFEVDAGPDRAAGHGGRRRHRPVRDGGRRVHVRAHVR